MAWRCRFLAARPRQVVRVSTRTLVDRTQGRHVEGPVRAPLRVHVDDEGVAGVEVALPLLLERTDLCGNQKFYGAFVLNRRVVSAHPTHWSISTQAQTASIQPIFAAWASAKGRTTLS